MVDMSVSVDATELLKATEALVSLFRDKTWPDICRKAGYEVSRSLAARTRKNTKPYPTDIRSVVSKDDAAGRDWFNDTDWARRHAGDARAVEAYWRLQMERGGFLFVFPDWPKFGEGKPYRGAYGADTWSRTSNAGRKSLRERFRYVNAGLAKQSWKWLQKKVDRKGGDKGKFAVNFDAVTGVDGPAMGRMHIHNKLKYMVDALPAGAVDSALNAAKNSVMGQIERRLAKKMGPEEARAAVEAMLRDLQERQE